MSNLILSKYRALTPVSDEAAVNDMWQMMMELTVPEAAPRWLKSEDTGYVFRFTSSKYPQYVLEYVQGSKQDSVTTLYRASPEVASLESISKVRSDLINEVGSVLMALPSTVVVGDAGREREVALKEMGTAQLVDLLAHFTHTDLKTI